MTLIRNVAQGFADASVAIADRTGVVFSPFALRVHRSPWAGWVPEAGRRAAASGEAGRRGGSELRDRVRRREFGRGAGPRVRARRKRRGTEVGGDRTGDFSV
jgi:hypothetical protein